MRQAEPRSRIDRKTTLGFAKFLKRLALVFCVGLAQTAFGQTITINAPLSGGQFCVGDNITISFTTTLFGSSGAFTAEIGTPTGTFTPSATLGTATGQNTTLTIGPVAINQLAGSYRIRVSRGGTNSLVPITVNANMTPTVNITANPSGVICSGTSVQFTAAVNNLAGGTVSYQWRLNTSNVGTNSTTYTTSSLANNDQVSCTITVTGGTCLTSTTATSTVITMAVNSAPNAGSNGTITVCSNGAAVNLFNSLGGTPQATGTWSGGLPGGHLGTFNPSTNSAGSYTYSVPGSAPCATATATVTVTMNSAPNAGSNGSITVCGNGAAVNLFNSLGGTPQTTGTWSGGLPGGHLGTFNPSTNSAGSYTYSVPGSAPCATATATVTVTMNSAPNAGSNGSITVCSNGAAVNLFNSLGGTPQTTGTWSGGLTGGQLGTFNPSTNSAGSYTYSVPGSAPCATATATVTVTMNSAPNAGSNGSITVCSNGAAVNLFNSLGGTPQTTGTWSGDLTGGQLGTFNPSINSAGSYTYSVPGSAPCATATATVIVTMNVAPSAGNNGTASVCRNGGPVDLFNFLLDDPPTTGTWSGGLTGEHLGTYTPPGAGGIFTYTVQGTLPCLPATATVIVSLSDPPSLPVSVNFLEDPPFCDGQFATLIASGGTTPAIYTWSCSNWETNPDPGPDLDSVMVRWSPNGAQVATIALEIYNGCTIGTTYSFDLAPDSSASCPQGIFFFAPQGLGVLDPSATWFDWGRVVNNGGVRSFDSAANPPSGATSQTMFDPNNVGPYANMDPLPAEPYYAVRTSRYSDGHCATTTTTWVDQVLVDRCEDGAGVQTGVQHKIYPNPQVGASLTIEAEGTSSDEPLDMELYDLGGRVVVREQHVVQPRAALNADLNTFERGLYILRIRNSEIDETFKLVLN